MSPSIYYISGLTEVLNPPTPPVEILMADERIWDKRNLNVIAYRDGTPIPEVTDAATFAALTTGAWCHYFNLASRGLVYGRLYNWYAMMGIWQTESVPPTPAQIADRKQIAPIGWSVASEAEWFTLRTVLGGINIAGQKLKEVGTSHWVPTNTGDNTSSFTALPGGFRGTIDFKALGTNGYWLVKDTTTPTTFTMASTSNTLTRSINSLWTYRGSSIRLIKDSGGIPGFITKTPTAGANFLSGTGGFIPTNYPEVPTEIGIVYGLTTNPTIVSPNIKIIYTPPGLGEYTINITGLTSSTRYYIRAYAILPSTGISYAPQVIVDTLSATPVVEANDVTEISTKTATCGGDVEQTGGLTLLERGVCWNTTGNPTTANSKATSTFAGGDGLGSFIVDITGLTPATTYYVRAYARNSSATGYGPTQKIFTTLTVPSINLIFNQYPAYHAYSLRRLSNDYNYKCLRVRRATTTPSATTTFVNVLFDSSGKIGLDSEIKYVSGYPTIATTLGEFAASVDEGYDNVDDVTENQNIFISIWYDQSGNVVNVINNTIAAQPKIVSGGLLDLGVKFSGAQILSVTDSSAPYYNESVYIVGSAASTTTMNFYGQGHLNANARMFIGREGGIWYNNSSTTTPDFPTPFAPNVTRLYELICGPSTTSAFTNGVSLGFLGSLTVTNAFVKIGANSSTPTRYSNGLVNEVIALVGANDTTDRNTIESNINGYYSIWT